MNLATTSATPQISTAQISVAPRQPRQQREPSPRDQRIYRDYQTTGLRQLELAEKYQLTQCRISQIIRRVEKWLHAGPEQRADDDDPSARQRLHRRLEYERLTAVCRQAHRHFHEQQKCVTHKTGTRGGTEIDETTERLLPPNLQCLKVILQANRQLSRLENQPPPEAAPQPTDGEGAPLAADGEATAEQRREEVEAWLIQQRDEAARAGVVSRGCNQTIIRDFVSALLGQPNRGLGLSAVARDAGKKIVDRKSYDDNPPPVPPRDGWYYPMYDCHGALVAWISADQLAGAIRPDYPPVQAPPPDTAPASAAAPRRTEDRGQRDDNALDVIPTDNAKPTSPAANLEPAVYVSGCPSPAPKAAVVRGSPDPALKAHSTTSPSALVSAQPSASPTLTSPSPPTTFPARTVLTAPEMNSTAFQLVHR